MNTNLVFYSSLLLSPTLTLFTTANNIDCEYSACEQILTSTDCQDISTQCQTYGGVANCNVGEFEYECVNIPLTGSSSCTTDASATSLCDTYTFPTIEPCAQTAGECEQANVVTRAPTPAGAITRIDCSYDSCSQLLTDTDCSSLTTQCANAGGVVSCIPGDNEFDCKNIPYTGTTACTDATATSQCTSYSYGGGYSCLEQEGECDDPISLTLAPTPATVSDVQRFDCDYDDCNTILTADDCAAISSTCAGYGGVTFCIPGDREFECNNIEWTNTSPCTDDGATNQCLQYSFGYTCDDKEGDCNYMSGGSGDDDGLSDEALVAIAVGVPILVVALGGVAWCITSSRAAKPPLASATTTSGL